MKEKTKFLLGIIAFIFVISASFLLYQYLGKNYASESGGLVGGATPAPQNNSSQEAATPKPERISAPDFSVEDREGNTVTFSELIGKPVVINFWASWCPPCKSEMPEFDTVYRELGEEVTFLMINSTDGARETAETAAAYIDGQGYSFPVYFDTGQEASYAYGISSLPTTVFIDRDGYLVTGAIGMIDEATLRRGIDMITKQTEEP